jgi:hypothetical protein
VVLGTVLLPGLRFRISLRSMDCRPLCLLCCVGKSLCDGLRIRSEESYRARVSVVYEPEKRGGLGPRWPDAPQEKNSVWPLAGLIY